MIYDKNMVNVKQKYNIVYSDCPWSYNVWNKKGARGCAVTHYPTMSTEDICALPVAEISAKDSTLFLWATFPNLPGAFKVIKAWGYRYVTVAFVWCKKNRVSAGYFLGMGHWTRANAEICLLAVKGKPKRISKSVRQIIDAPVGRHSEKPAEVRTRIVELMGDLPRIELFAREKTDGWSAWGHEVESDITL